MGRIVRRNQPCIIPACKSSDAVQVYEDGGARCFSCDHQYKPGEYDGEYVEKGRKPSQNGRTALRRLALAQIAELRSRGFQERAIRKVVCEFYGVKVRYDGDTGEIDAHYYPYEDGKSYKARELPKTFYWVGPHSASLFGKEKFNGGGRRLIICEGEMDCLSVAWASYRRYSKFYPIVAVSSSAMANKLLEHREWIRSFKEVVIMFDEDDAGEKAKREACRIIGFDKAKLTKLRRNDANEVLVNDGPEALMEAVFDAIPYKPSGFIGKDALWKELEEYNNTKSVPYPPCMAGVNGKLKGMRGGEIALFISGTGSGKSTMLREIILHILHGGVVPDDHRLGVMSFEEAPAETARKLSGMYIHRNPAKDEIPLEELKPGFDAVFGKDRIELLNHQGSMNDDSLIDKLEYMALAGCKYILIDHITILVSEGVENLQGNEAQDKIMNDLLRLVKRYPDVWVGLVSHLRKAPNDRKSFEEGRLPSLDDIRGSGSVKQVSFDIIAFARHLTAASDKERNTIKMRVLKCRFTGLTGDVPGAFYDYDTGRLHALDYIPEEDEEFSREVVEL